MKEQDRVVYLTADQILALHSRAIEEFGGAAGLRSEHQFLPAVSQPQQSAFGEDAYPTIHDKAAAYGFFLSENQPFVDGNKRTAAWAMETFLELNGYEFNPSDEEMERVFLELGSRKIDQPQFFEWVRSNTRPQSDLRTLPKRED